MIPRFSMNDIMKSKDMVYLRPLGLYSIFMLQ